MLFHIVLLKSLLFEVLSISLKTSAFITRKIKNILKRAAIDLLGLNVVHAQRIFIAAVVMMQSDSQLGFKSSSLLIPCAHI